MWVGDRDGLAGIIDKDLLTTFVEKTHRRLQALGPCLIQSTELAVAVTIRVGFAILDPQQPQGYTLFVQLGVNEGPIRTGDDTRTRRRRLGKKEPVQPVLAHVGRQRPFQPGFLGAAEVLGHGTVGDGTTAGDCPVGQAALPLQTKNLAILRMVNLS